MKAGLSLDFVSKRTYNYVQMEIDIKEIKQKIEGASYLTRKNLQLLLGSNRRTTDGRIRSLIKTGVLIRLKNGFYISRRYMDKESTLEKYREYLANMLYPPSYISLKYAMSVHGLIPEGVYSITSVTSSKTKTFDSSLGVFIYKKVKNELFGGYISVPYKNLSISFALKAKCLFDFIYLAKLPLEIKDIENYLTSESRINWAVLNPIDKQEFRYWIKKSDSKKMKKLERIMVELKLI